MFWLVFYAYNNLMHGKDSSFAPVLINRPCVCPFQRSVAFHKDKVGYLVCHLVNHETWPARTPTNTLASSYVPQALFRVTLCIMHSLPQ